MYDQGTRTRILTHLVRDIFNGDGSFFGLSVMDPGMVAEHVMQMGRENGVGDQACFFGRVQLERDPSALQPGQRSSKMVYTSATVRSLEQVCQAVKMRESMLLVGETGTGKTTLVQELASTLGKKLHVFNMN